ncbi:hypothetical protein [Lacisediminimonas sp.]|uniref:hypothetical protein n=1 Tax=Lacisediminimonas sp. TaxID=3060582 RepID=UPI0027267D81|nr:hypothetical protein [Lacisediminimonas sp.]MDO8299176.1 hypothetical protein [Lacisediminimonas sp.]
MTAATLLIASGCAMLAPPSVSPGESETAIVARMGRPSGVYQDGADRLLEYRTNPGGQQTWMVRLDASGRARSIEQVLTSEKFATLRINQDRREDVLRKVGAPYERSYLSIPELDVWTYMYKENGVWDRLMHIHFDRNGTLKMLMNARDYMRDPDPGGFGP